MLKNGIIKVFSPETVCVANTLIHPMSKADQRTKEEEEEDDDLPRESMHRLEVILRGGGPWCALSASYNHP